MNVTYVLIGAIVGLAILAIVFKQRSYDGDWQVQGAALSFAENFEGSESETKPVEVENTDEHGKAEPTTWTPELEAEKQALDAALAKKPEKFEPEDIEDAEAFEGFDNDGGELKMPYLGVEYASV